MAVGVVIFMSNWFNRGSRKPANRVGKLLIIKLLIMKKITIGLALAALVTGVVVFSSFTILDNEISKKSSSSSQNETTDPLYFRYLGSTHSPSELQDADKWIFEGKVNPATDCNGGTIVCRIELAPADNPGIADTEDQEVAALLFAAYLESQDGSGSYDSSVDFVEQNLIATKMP